MRIGARNSSDASKHPTEPTLQASLDKSPTKASSLRAHLSTPFAEEELLTISKHGTPPAASPPPSSRVPHQAAKADRESLCFQKVSEDSGSRVICETPGATENTGTYIQDRTNTGTLVMRRYALDSAGYTSHNTQDCGGLRMQFSRSCGSYTEFHECSHSGASRERAYCGERNGLDKCLMFLVEVICVLHSVFDVFQCRPDPSP